MQQADWDTQKRRAEHVWTVALGVVGATLVGPFFLIPGLMVVHLVDCFKAESLTKAFGSWIMYAVAALIVYFGPQLFLDFNDPSWPLKTFLFTLPGSMIWAWKFMPLFWSLRE